MLSLKKIIKKIIPPFLFDWYHFILAFLGAFFYDFPSKKMTVIGITGTNGKSTVVHLVTKIFEEAGLKTASISSVRFKIYDKAWPNVLKMTMPGRWQIQKFLKDALNQKCNYAILEVTSEGIKQYRHKFINFQTAVFVNLTPEHIEAHGSFEKYRATKAKLFEIVSHHRDGIGIYNLDDSNVDFFLKIFAKNKYGYTLARQSRHELDSKLNSQDLNLIRAIDCQASTQGIKFSVNNTEFNLKLLGEFNICNALAAICVGLSQGIDSEIIKKALEKSEGVAGRMEIVVSQPFIVIVDYAHTPDSLQKVYETVGDFKSTGAKIIGVLGAAGGGRDKWKRPVMGKIASQYCDHIILTNEDPYDENPEAILNEIASGFSQFPIFNSQFPNHEKILDRREAIRKALNLAKQNDIIIITGKGCEPWMVVAGNRKTPWDDRKIVREEFEKLKRP